MPTQKQLSYKDLDSWTRQEIITEIARIKLLPHIEALTCQFKAETESPYSFKEHKLDNDTQKRFYNALKKSSHKHIICESCIKRHIENRKLSINPHFLGVWYVYGCPKCPTITAGIEKVKWVKTFYDKLNTLLKHPISYRIFKKKKSYTIECIPWNIIWGKFYRLRLCFERVIPEIYFESSLFNRLLVVNGMCTRYKEYFEIPVCDVNIVRLLDSCKLKVVYYDGVRIRFKGNSEFKKVFKYKSKLMS